MTAAEKTKAIVAMYLDAAGEELSRVRRLFQQGEYLLAAQDAAMLRESGTELERACAGLAGRTVPRG